MNDFPKIKGWVHYVLEFGIKFIKWLILLHVNLFKARSKPLKFWILDSFIGCLENGPCFFNSFSRGYILELLIRDCTDPNTRFQSPTREGCWLQISSIHPHDEDLENAWSQNPTMHKHSNLFRRDELGRNFVSDYKFLEQTLLNTCAICVHFDGP